MSARSDCVAAALACLARGWSVLPLRPGEKRPLLRWEALQLRVPDRAAVMAWFRRWPAANLGIVTGAVSGLIVIDVDAGHGGDVSLSRLESRHGALPATICALTGGGGRHLYFAHPGGVLRNRAGLAPGIDLRGDGGYVVAPPSLHPSGRRYAWMAGCDPARMAAAPVPDWLRALLAGDRATPHGHGVSHWRVLVAGGVAEGTRNSSIAALAGHLLWHGIDPAVAQGLLLAWNSARCRPPLPDAEVAAVVASIARLHARALRRA